MPKSLLVFAVSSTPGTPNFGTFGGVAHPLEDFFIFASKVCMCTYLYFKLWKKLILKKKDFREQNHLNLEGVHSTT